MPALLAAHAGAQDSAATSAPPSASQAPPTIPAAVAAAPADAGVSGTVSGHVRGPNGVAVPGATVDLIEEQTGERKETWTDEAGNYTLSGVKPGTYKLAVSLVGFRTDVRQPVPVAAGNPLKANLALVISKPEETASSRQGSGNAENLGSPPGCPGADS